MAEQMIITIDLKDHPLLWHRINVAALENEESVEDIVIERLADSFE